MRDTNREGTRLFIPSDYIISMQTKKILEANQGQNHSRIRLKATQADLKYELFPKESNLILSPCIHALTSQLS